MIIYSIAACAMIALALYGIITAKTHVRRLIGFNVFISGVFLVFISTSYAGEVDSVASALVLTGLVVSVSASAFGLMLIRASGESE